MVNRTAGTNAPINVIGLVRTIYWPVTFIPLAKAGCTLRHTAAIVVRDHVVAAIFRVAAGADPGDGRHLRTGRAAVVSSAAAFAQKTIDGAVAPIVATGRVAGFRGLFRLFRRASNR